MKTLALFLSLPLSLSAADLFERMEEKGYVSPPMYVTQKIQPAFREGIGSLSRDFRPMIKGNTIFFINDQNFKCYNKSFQDYAMTVQFEQVIVNNVLKETVEYRNCADEPTFTVKMETRFTKSAPVFIPIFPLEEGLIALPFDFHLSDDEISKTMIVTFQDQVWQKILSQNEGVVLKFPPGSQLIFENKRINSREQLSSLYVTYQTFSYFGIQANGMEDSGKVSINVRYFPTIKPDLNYWYEISNSLLHIYQGTNSSEILDIPNFKKNVIGLNERLSSEMLNFLTMMPMLSFPRN